MKTRLLAPLLLSITACAGGRTNLRFDETAYPVSLSPTVLGRDGGVLLPKAREVVGQLEIETKAWGLLWAAVPLTPNKDLSARINEQVERAGGEAVVNLRITSRQCGVNHAWVLSTVPLWPGCARIFVQGDIIRELTMPAAVPPPELRPAPDFEEPAADPTAAPPTAVSLAGGVP